jgi:hypothetical protein
MNSATGKAAAKLEMGYEQLLYRACSVEYRKIGLGLLGPWHLVDGNTEVDNKNSFSLETGQAAVKRCLIHYLILKVPVFAVLCVYNYEFRLSRTLPYSSSCDRRWIPVAVGAHGCKPPQQQ